MSFTDTLSLFGVMLILALTPGIGVLTVTTRTLAGGFAHGLATTAGMIIGDIVFILLAVYGLALFAETLSSLFIFLNLGGGLYLLYLGITLWRNPVPTDPALSTRPKPTTLYSSVLTGLLITLGNQKAILFYVSFLPTFLDLTAFTVLDTVRIIMCATLAIGITMTTYTILVVTLPRRPRSRFVPRLAGSTLILVALVLFTRAIQSL